MYIKNPRINHTVLRDSYQKKIKKYTILTFLRNLNI